MVGQTLVLDLNSPRQFEFLHILGHEPAHTVRQVDGVIVRHC